MKELIHKELKTNIEQIYIHIFVFSCEIHCSSILIPLYLIQEPVFWYMIVCFLLYQYYWIQEFNNEK